MKKNKILDYSFWGGAVLMIVLFANGKHNLFFAILSIISELIWGILYIIISSKIDKKK